MCSSLFSAKYFAFQLGIIKLLTVLIGKPLLRRLIKLIKVTYEHNCLTCPKPASNWCCICSPLHNFFQVQLSIIRLIGSTEFLKIMLLKLSRFLIFLVDFHGVIPKKLTEWILKYWISLCTQRHGSVLEWPPTYQAYFEKNTTSKSSFESIFQSKWRCFFQHKSFICGFV